MRKTTRSWIIVWCKVVGAMASSTAATLTVMDPNVQLSNVQFLIVICATAGTGALTLSSALDTIPGEPDPLASAEVRKIFGRPRKDEDLS